MLRSNAPGFESVPEVPDAARMDHPSGLAAPDGYVQPHTATGLPMRVPGTKHHSFDGAIRPGPPLAELTDLPVRDRNVKYHEDARRRGSGARSTAAPAGSGDPLSLDFDPLTAPWEQVQAWANDRNARREPSIPLKRPTAADDIEVPVDFLPGRSEQLRKTRFTAVLGQTASAAEVAASKARVLTPQRLRDWPALEVLDSARAVTLRPAHPVRPTSRREPAGRGPGQPPSPFGTVRSHRRIGPIGRLLGRRTRNSN